MLNLKINNLAANFVIDTGASNTVLDLNTSSKFIKKEKIVAHQKLSSGLGTNQMKSSISKKQELKIGNLIFKHSLVILDLSHINHSYNHLGLKAIDGVLGCDILVKYNGIINLKNKELTLRKAI